MAECLDQPMRETSPTPISRRGALRRLLGSAVAGVLATHPAALARAQGTPAASPVASAAAGEEVEFLLSGGVTTRGQFDYPPSAAPPFPAVLLLQGSGATDRHETFVAADGAVHRPFDLIAAELTRRGLAVFRFDKRGVCPPSRICDPAAYAAQTIPMLVDDAALAYARMIANPLIDAARTAILGHSEGAWLAPAIAARVPDIRALVLIGTGLGPMHALTFSQVTLPLLGVAPFDTDDDGAIAADEVPFADPAALARFLPRIRPQGQLFLLRYEGSGAELRPVGLNPVIDTNRDGALDLLTEVRPVYEAFLAGIAHPLVGVQEYADPSIRPLAEQLFAEAEAFDAGIYSSYLAEPSDQQLRTLLSLPGRPRLLIVNGEHDDQTSASSARLLAAHLTAAGYDPAPVLRIYPGLGHVLGRQDDLFAPVSLAMEPEPIADIGVWLAMALASE